MSAALPALSARGFAVVVTASHVEGRGAGHTKLVRGSSFDEELTQPLS